ncbi:hypothetical protein HGG78_16125 [Vibrio aestuarianus]|uniref:hypothetical protein n=1 Tax=Vibrio aestuarianus TaxID=28171 RepID=UPI0015593373|nr:hypothetical protein [Vibrio aestuarianus]NGZ15265.1 hypothetical protein [Vibrio aestuarianus]NKZ51413.1 hypothetical protein [Vibrio aestuarianus]
MDLVNELLNQDFELSPECRFVSLALHLDSIRTSNLLVDISASRLKNDFGVSHKTAQTVIELFKEKGRGRVGKTIKSERQFIFNLDYLERFSFETICFRIKLVNQLLSLETRLKIEKFKDSEGGFKLRNSNLLLMIIFVLHSNEVGFVRNLTNKRMRELMGGISESRLKSQLEALSKVGFLKAIGRGGSFRSYFGKMSNRYFIELYHLPFGRTPNPSCKDTTLINNVESLTYEIPEKFLRFKFESELELLKIDFDFEFPFKVAFLFGALKLSKKKEKRILDFPVAQLDPEAFNGLLQFHLPIMGQVERVVVFILENYWNQVQTLNHEPVDNTSLELVSKTIWDDERFQKNIDSGAMFSDKYRNEKVGEAKKSDQLEPERVFLGRVILYLSLNLASSLQTILIEKCLVTNGLRNINVILYDLEPYNSDKLGIYLPSFGLSCGFYFDSKFFFVHLKHITKTKVQCFAELDALVKSDESTDYQSLRREIVFPNTVKYELIIESHPLL